MRVKIIAAGSRLPDWLNQGYQEYAKRLSRDMPLELVEIPVSRSSSHKNTLMERAREGKLMRAAIPESAYIVALEVGGRRLSTEGLAEFLSKRLMEGRDLALLIGGPEGIEPELSQSAHFKWSLSDLTLPHALARVVLAEAIYRAHSVLKGHPYHRA